MMSLRPNRGRHQALWMERFLGEEGLGVCSKSPLLGILNNTPCPSIWLKMYIMKLRCF